MAAQTVGAWTDKSVRDFYIATCEVTTDAINEILFTNKTPVGLDGSKPWTLIIAADAAQDGVAAPVALHVGTADDFALAGTTARATVTSGSMYGNVIDDLGYAGAVAGISILMDPNLVQAVNVTLSGHAAAGGLMFKPPPAPYYAFELYAADSATLLAHTLTYTIIQKK